MLVTRREAMALHNSCNMGVRQVVPLSSETSQGQHYQVMIAKESTIKQMTTECPCLHPNQLSHYVTETLFLVPFPRCAAAGALFLGLSRPARRKSFLQIFFHRNRASCSPHAFSPFPRPPLSFAAAFRASACEMTNHDDS